ncbi:MAG: DUF692 family protein [Colwellia sp.]
MKVGVNWSGQRELPALRDVLNKGNVDFVEILIDNFLCVDPKEISNFLSGIPVNFHIMNSKFLFRDERELFNISNSINRLADHLQPGYISDHIGIFYADELPLPQMAEISYTNDIESTLTSISIWSKLLGTELLLENYPSKLTQNIGQAEFYEIVLKESNSKLLFDISNAVIASINTGYELSNWKHLIKNCQNFHIGGYEFSSTLPSLAIDTHAERLSESTLNFARNIFSEFNDITVSVERSDNFSPSDWLADVNMVRDLNNEYA